jgi:hypothetical protein
MTKKEFTAVKTGDIVLHKHFGKCLIQEIKWSRGDLFGVILLPQEEKGKELLTYYSGMPIGTPLLEGSLYQIRPLNRPFKETAE